MSHYAVGVIVPTENMLDEQYLEQLIDDYNENMEVDEYEKTCSCVISMDHKKAREIVEAEIGSIEERRAAFEEREDVKARVKEAKEKDIPEFIMLQDLWTEHIQVPFERKYNEVLESMPKEEQAKPDPECEDCHGTGIVKSRYNPLSKWDWYTIGGRWEQNGDLGENTLSVTSHLKEIEDPDKAFFAYVEPDPDMDPEERWHEKAEMHMFGCTSKNKYKKEWQSEVKELLGKYKDHVIVIVDCHI